ILAFYGIAALTGWAYMRLLQAGNRPGEWLYKRLLAVESSFSPTAEVSYAHHSSSLRKKVWKEAKKTLSYTQEDIDAILEKIHQEGYDSLTREEKAALLKASKEKS